MVQSLLGVPWVPLCYFQPSGVETHYDADQRDTRRVSCGESTRRTETKTVKLAYTLDKPTEPGWYWCHNPVESAEFICRIDRSATITPTGVEDAGLVCAWMTAPGSAGTLHESEWAPYVEWCGPLTPPPNRNQSMMGEIDESRGSCAG